MSEEKLVIHKCPICGGRHTYRLKVERTYIMKLLTMSDLKEPSQPVRFTRIFVCPTKNKKFQASFILYQTSLSQIKSVTVEGVSVDEEKS